MANRYLVATGNFSSTSVWSTSDGGSPGASVPTSADSAMLTAASGAVTLTVDVASSCLDLDCTGFTGTLAGSQDLNIYGSLTLGSGMTRTYNGSITFLATTTGKTITCAGVSLGFASIFFSGVGGGWTLQDNLTVNGFYPFSGVVDTNNKTLSVGAFQSNGSLTRSLVLGSSVITCSYWILIGSNITFNAGTSTINATSTVAYFNSNGQTYYNVNLTTNATGPTSSYISGVNTFNNLSINGQAQKTGVLALQANQTVNGTFTVNGNSATNRILVQSNILGTPRTITAATVGTCSNVDFQDIVGSGAGSWNLSAITGGSGNCGGNTGITFTTSANMYWKHGASASVSISTAANWYLATNGGGGAGRVPLPQDTGIFDANSFSATGKAVIQDMPRIGGLDWSASTNAPTWNTNTTAGGVNFSVFGSVILATGMNPSQIFGYVWMTLAGRGSYSIKCAGFKLAFPRLLLSCPGGTYTQLDDFVGGDTSISTTLIFNPNYGTWVANGFNFTSTVLDDTQTGSSTITPAETLNMGSGTWTINGNDTNGNSATFKVSTTATITPGTSTLVFTDSTTNTKTIVGNGCVFNSLTLGGTGTGSFLLASFIASGATAVSCTGAASVNLCTAITSSYTDLDFTGFVGTWVGTIGFNIKGNFKLSSLMTITNSGGITFNSASAKTITTNGKTIPFNMTFSSTISFGYQLLDDLVLNGPSISLTQGTLDFNNRNVTCGAFTSSGTTRVLTMGSGTITITGTGSSWNMSPTSMTLNCGTSTLKFTNNSAFAKSFISGALVYYKIWNATLGTGTFSYVNSTSATYFVSDAGRTNIVNGGVNLTLANASSFVSNGTAGNLTVWKSSSPGSLIWRLICTSGAVSSDYLYLGDSTAQGGATFDAGTHSTNAGNNTGWTFGAGAPAFSNPGAAYAFF